MRTRTWSAAYILFLAGAGVALADRGAIPFRPEVTIFEPTQRAMIEAEQRVVRMIDGQPMGEVADG